MPRSFTRRQAMAAGGAAELPLVHVRTGHAAGKVTVAFWDHWVSAGDDITKEQCAACALKIGI